MMTPIEVLLVEDNPADADLVRESLEEARLLARLSVVGDGEKAEAWLLRQPPYTHVVRPDLILLDLNLPRRSGREVLKTIRDTPSLRHIPVVVLSSSDMETDIFRTYGLGANCYLVKPVRVTDFFKMMQQVGEFWFSVVRLPPRHLLAAREQYLPPRRMLSSLMTEVELELLLVEDNPTDVELTREHLAERPGWHLYVCTRLSDVWERAEARSVDVVLLDLGLPDSHGLGALEQVRERLPQVPVIVLTGGATHTLGPLAVRSGAQDFLEKDMLTPQVLTRSILYALERAAVERERDVLLARANEVRQKAEEAVLLRDEFLSVASHELKTPLTSLMLQLQWMERLGDSQGTINVPAERLRRAVGSMRRQSEQLARLIKELLDTSRVASGRLKLEHGWVDLSHMVRECVERLQPQAEQAGVVVRLQAEPEVVGFWDRFRLEQVVVNLLTNALKYGKGKPVQVRVARQQGQGLLEVKDSGIGIREEDQQRVFERFERAVSARHFGGLGLGLYISRQIVDAHAGTIELTSQEGQGSCFTVRLPLEKAADLAESPAGPPRREGEA